MLIDYILESGSEILLLGVDYFPEALVAAVDTDRCFWGGVRMTDALQGIHI